MTAEIYIAIVGSLMVSISLHFLYVCWFTNNIKEATDFLISPATLHKMTKMNWAGCIVYWILGLALAPIFTITGIFAWLFTVGRRD